MRKLFLLDQQVFICYTLICNTYNKTPKRKSYVVFVIHTHLTGKGEKYMLTRLVSILFCGTILLSGNILCTPTLSTSLQQKEEYMTIQNTLLTPESVNILKECNATTLTKEEYDKYVAIMKSILQGSHDMPAFGVSLDLETKQALQKGIWLQLTYPATQEVNGLPFDTLLIELHPDHSGFNIIRGNNGIYDGRCFYIDLVENTLSPIYEWANNQF